MYKKYIIILFMGISLVVKFSSLYCSVAYLTFFCERKLHHWKISEDFSCDILLYTMDLFKTSKFTLCYPFNRTNFTLNKSETKWDQLSEHEIAFQGFRCTDSIISVIAPVRLTTYGD